MANRRSTTAPNEAKAKNAFVFANELPTPPIQTGSAVSDNQTMD
jgi:hypothetical protein